MNGGEGRTLGHTLQQSWLSNQDHVALQNEAVLPLLEGGTVETMPAARGHQLLRKSHDYVGILTLAPVGMNVPMI